MGKVIGCSRHVDAGMCTLQHGDSMGNVALFAGANSFEFLTQYGNDVVIFGSRESVVTFS